MDRFSISTTKRKEADRERDRAGQPEINLNLKSSALGEEDDILLNNSSGDEYNQGQFEFQASKE